MSPKTINLTPCIV